MLTRIRSRRWAVLVVAAVVAGVLAGGVVASQFSWLDDPETFGEAVETGQLMRVADIGATADSPGRGVFVQRTSTGHLCLWDAPSATSSKRLGGCNSADDPLGGRKLMVSFAYDGGPAPADVRDARLVGLVSSDVAEVQVLMSNGARLKMPLRNASIGDEEYRAFGHRINKADLRGGNGPTAVLALSKGGAEIDRQATGFAG